MRKEFSHARSLSLSQAQILRAHDEIKMATSRLRLRETKDEASAIDVLSTEELISTNMHFTSEKFTSLSMLSRIKGHLRYLKVKLFMSRTCRQFFVMATLIVKIYLLI